MNKRRAFAVAVAWSFLAILRGLAEEAKPPVRFAIVGLTHDHARGFIPAARDRGDVLLAGIVESDRELVARYAKAYQLNPNLFYSSLEDLLRKTNVQAVYKEIGK